MTLKDIKYLNNGTNGCVLQPAASCSDDSTLIGNVSKLFLKKEAALIEMMEHKGIISKVDPKNKFTVNLNNSCYIKKTSFNDVELNKCTNFTGQEIPEYIYQLVYDYGGLDLINAQIKFGFNELFLNMKQIFVGLVEMKKHSCIHLDIKPHNIVYNNETKKMRLIDFGNSIMNTSVYKKKYLFVLNHTYLYYPLEFRIASLSSTNIIHEHLEANWKSFFIIFGDIFEGILNSTQKFRHFSKLLHSFKDFKIDQSNIQKYFYYQNKEILDDHLYQIDVYSFGVTIFELLIKSIAMNQIVLDESNIDLYINILYLIKNMTRSFPYERYTPEQALNNYEFIIKTYKKSFKPTKNKTRPQKTRNTKKSREVKQCSEDKELNIETNRCIKKCKDGYIRNYSTKRCVKNQS